MIPGSEVLFPRMMNWQ